MTGMSLQQMASIAEIVGALTIVSGLVFGWFQIRVYRAQQRDLIATNLMQTFYNPELARAVSLLHQVPDGISANQLRDVELFHIDQFRHRRVHPQAHLIPGNLR